MNRRTYVRRKIDSSANEDTPFRLLLVGVMFIAIGLTVSNILHGLLSQ